MAKTKLNEQGYVIFEDSGKLVHRWVAEKKHPDLKPLPDNLEVHHINKDRQDNSPHNLIILHKTDHYDLGQYENKKDLLITFILFLVVALYFIQFLPLMSIPKLVVNTMGGMLISIIVVLLLELKNNLFSNLIRRPNERFE